MGTKISKPISHGLNNYEKGQAIALIALALAALLGIMSLALDGGRVFADRRKAQNTADTSAFAGGLIIAQADNGNPTDLPAGTFSEAIAKAFERAASNGYDDIDPDVDVSVSVSGPTLEDGSYYYTVRVEIISRIDGLLTALVYSGQLSNTVYAIAKVTPIQGLAWGNSLYATSEDECDAMLFSGSGEVNILDGGIFSNSKSGKSNCASLTRRGTSNVNVQNGGISAAGKYKNSGASGSLHPPTSEDVAQGGIAEVPDPDCSNLAYRGDAKISPGTTVTLLPGIYDGINILGGKANPAEVKLSPGMYCIIDDGFSATGGYIFGNGVFIYLMGGNFNVSATTIIFLAARQELYDASGNFWGGMLIYMPASNPGTITLSGTSSSVFSGTIFAPDPAKPASRTRCKVLGSSDGFTINSQIICYSIEITGDGNLSMLYNANANFKFGSAMSQLE